MTWHGRGSGKVILLGEHAAVYGYPALAGAIARGVDVTATVRPGPLALTVAAWSIAVTAESDHPVARAVIAIAAHFGIRDGLELIATTDLAAGAGLGSSAALAVALAKTFAAHARPDATPAELAVAADLGERCFHGNPSGLDVALALCGGFGRFVRGVGLTTIDAPPLELAIGLSGHARSTAAMVAAVDDRRRASPAAIDAALAHGGAAADAGTHALVDGDLVALGGLMSMAHDHLRAIGVSTPALDAMTAAAISAGALGAKLTGAGGGGAVIALAPGCDDAVLAAWRALGYDGFVTAIGSAS